MCAVGGTAVVGLVMYVASACLGLRSKEGHRVFCVLHHVVVASLALMSRSRAVTVAALALELGFEVSDSFFCLFGEGSWTGLPGAAVYVHHVLSAALEALAMGLVLVDSLEGDRIAPLFFCLIAAGAADLCWAKLFVFPRNSVAQWTATIAYSLSFAYLRVFRFWREGMSLLAATSSLPRMVGVIAHAAFVLFCLYHALLGIGILAAWRHGGRLPEKK